MRPRLALTGLVAGLSIAVVLAGAARSLEPASQPTAPGPDEWRSFEAAEERDATFEQLDEAIEAERAGLDECVPDTRGAVEDVLRLVRAWIDDNATLAYQARIDAGMVFRREAAIKQCRTLARWRFVAHRSEDWLTGATDAEVFEMVAQGQRGSGLLLDAVDIGAVRVGRRVGLTMGSEDWPYKGTQGCYSLFAGPGGQLLDLQSVDRTPNSFFVIMRVRFHDQRVGLLFFCHAWDAQIGAWVPVSVDVGVDSGQYWPWPAAN